MYLHAVLRNPYFQLYRAAQQWRIARQRLQPSQTMLAMREQKPQHVDIRQIEARCSLQSHRRVRTLQQHAAQKRQVLLPRNARVRGQQFLFRTPEAPQVRVDVHAGFSREQ